MSSAILNIAENWLQSPSAVKRRFTGDGAAAGGDPTTPGNPASLQLVGEAVDMLSNLMASPDKASHLPTKKC